MNIQSTSAIKKSLSSDILSDARQPKVDLLHTWAVIGINVWANRLYKRKNT